jgi:hypothetical protein
LAFVISAAAETMGPEAKALYMSRIQLSRQNRKMKN